MDGNPVYGSGHYQRSTSTYDAAGNERTGISDKLGRTVRNADGYHRVHREYDFRGNIKSWSYFDETDHPVLGPDGYAKMTASYDKRDNENERAYYDVGGRLTEVSGYAIWTRTYDACDRVVKESYLNLKRESATGSKGYARASRTYDGNTIEEHRFAANGSPTLECPIVRLATDSRTGDVVEDACLDASGWPARTHSGYAVKRTKYDDHGRQIDIAYFADSKPALEPRGFAIERRTYDARGNVIEFAYYGGTAS